MRASVCGKGHDLTDPANVKLRVHAVNGATFQECRVCQRDRALAQRIRNTTWPQVHRRYLRLLAQRGVRA